MSSKSDNDLMQITVIAVVAVIAFMVWKFSTFFGLPWEIGGHVILYSIITIIFASGWCYFRSSYDPLPIWPLVLFFLYCSWFPAIDYWGVETTSRVYFSSYNGLKDFTDVAWYARWYTKVLISLIILVGGYYLDPKLKNYLH